MEKFKLNKFENDKDFDEIIKFCQDKYGNVIRFIVKNKDDFYKDYLELINYKNDENKYPYSNIKEINITLKNMNNEWFLVTVNILDKTITSEKIDIKFENDIKQNEKHEDFDISNYQIPDDPNLEFYIFDGNILVKYDKTEMMYYVYNQKENSWDKQDELVNEWLYSGDHDCVILEKQNKSKK